MYLKQIFIFIVGFIMLSGCGYQGQSVENNIEENYDNVINSNENYEEEKNIMYSMGIRMRKVSNDPEKDKIVILVNGQAITKEEVEGKKIVSEFSSIPIKDQLNKLIRERVMSLEAVRLDIKPDKKKLSSYIEETREFLKTGEAVAINAYIEGRGITQDEYLELLEEEQYKIEQRVALWESVRSVSEITEESKKRGVSFGDVDYEYYEKYVDELMKNADIEFLDPEIERIFID